MEGVPCSPRGLPLRRPRRGEERHGGIRLSSAAGRARDSAPGTAAGNGGLAKISRPPRAKAVRPGHPVRLFSTGRSESQPAENIMGEVNDTATAAMRVESRLDPLGEERVIRVY